MNNSMNKRFRECISIHRYPQYFTDILASRLFLLLHSFSGRFHIGADPIIRGLPIISLFEGSRIEIGDRAYLISRSVNTALGVNHPVVLRTLKNKARVAIGNDFGASGASICCAFSITIGNRVKMGANAIVTDTDFHSLDPQLRASNADLAHASFRPVRIGSDVFVGAGAYILKGVTIGDYAIIGAGAVITRDVPSRAIMGGNPGRLIGTV